MLVNAEQPDKSTSVSEVHPDRARTSETATHPLKFRETRELHEAAREVTSAKLLHPDKSSAMRLGQEARQLTSTTLGQSRNMSDWSDEQAASELTSAK